MISLIVGTLLALAALAYVLYPLLSGGPPETDADARVRDVRRVRGAGGCAGGHGQRAGLQIAGWPTRSEADAKLAVALGVNTLTTDVPSQLLEKKP